MDNCFLIVNKIAKNKAKDHISLSYDERFLRRKKLVSDNGATDSVFIHTDRGSSEFIDEFGNKQILKESNVNLM